MLLPDEYIYTELARSFGAHGLPEIRGALYPFPALLTPLLTAPAWLVSDVGTAYRLAQAEGALAFSLAAVPAYGLARHLGATSRVALLVAATAAFVPDAIDGGLLLSEPFAYPLFLAAVWALVVSLSGGGRRSRVAFLALTILACLARVQLVVLPVAYGVALLAMSGRQHTVVRTLRAHALPVGVFLAAAVAAAAAGPARAAGVYGAIFGADFSAPDLAHWLAVDAVIVCVAAGWVLVPGAALGFGAAIARPAGRAEEAFGWAGATLTLLLLVEAAFFGRFTAQLVERYAFYAAPLIVLAFAVAHGRGLLRTRKHLVGCVALAVLGVLSPLMGDLFFSSPDQSPVLIAFAPLHRLLDWRAPIVVGPALAALAVAALALGSRGRGAVLAGVAAALCLVVSVFASFELREHSLNVGDGGGSFVDRAAVGDAPYLGFRGTGRGAVLTTLFWNRSVDRVFRIGVGTDGFASTEAHIGPDGSILAGNRELKGPLVVDRTGAYTRFRSGRMAAQGTTSDLWTGDLRLGLLVDGYYGEGRWLAGAGTVDGWGAGSLVLRVHADEHRPQHLVFRSGAKRIAVRVGPRPQTIVLPLGSGRWSWVSNGTLTLIGGHIVSLHVDLLRWRPAA